MRCIKYDDNSVNKETIFLYIINYAKIIPDYPSNASSESTRRRLHRLGCIYSRRGSTRARFRWPLRDLSIRPVKTSRNVKRSSRPPGKRQRGIFVRSDFLEVSTATNSNSSSPKTDLCRISLVPRLSFAVALFRGRTHCQRNAADYSRNFQSRRVTRDARGAAVVTISIFRYFDTEKRGWPVIMLL